MKNPFDEHWRSSLPLSLGGVVTSDVIAWIARVDWGAFFAAAALAITAIGGAAIGLYRQWRLTQIEIEERERSLSNDRDAAASSDGRDGRGDLDPHRDLRPGGDARSRP
jgi:hypothetical protein